MNDKQAYDVVNEIVSCWIEQEKPLICGKQLITRSFFLKDFVGRKLITAMPETESNSWRLIFEGGHQLNINENLLYSKGTLNPNDLGVFLHIKCSICSSKSYLCIREMVLSK